MVYSVTKGFKDFFFGDVVAVFVSEKGQFTKAIQYSDKIDFETFFCGKLQVGNPAPTLPTREGVGTLKTVGTNGTLLLKELYFSVYNTASVLRVLLFVQGEIDNLQ